MRAEESNNSVQPSGYSVLKDTIFSPAPTLRQRPGPARRQRPSWIKRHGIAGAPVTRTHHFGSMRSKRPLASSVSTYR
jgi:hypothetical protein